MLKKITVFVVAFLFCFPASSQTWQWARSGVGYNGFAEGLAVCTDPFGNAITTGFFQSPQIVFGTYTLNLTGSYNVFVVKYAPNGTVLWARASTGPNTQEGRGICSDPSGNIYVSGIFAGATITFGTFTLTNAGGTNAFLVKYDPNGNVLWAKASSANQGCVGQSVATDNAGNVLMHGWFTGSSVAFSTTTLTQSGISNLFLVKYDPSGNLTWARKSFGGGSHLGYSVGTDASGNAFVTGGFSGQIAVLGTFTLNNTGADDVYLAKYDGNGNALWARNASGTGSDKGQALSVDATGNPYITGFFGSPSLAFGTFTCNNTGSNDAFIAKYDSNGNALWAKSVTGTGNDYGYGIAAAGSGAFITGAMGTFGSANGGAPVVVGSFSLTPPVGASDPMFVAQYDGSGNAIWAQALGAGGDDVCAIAADNACNIYVSGDFYNLDPFVIGNDSLHISGMESIFTAKLSFGTKASITVSNATICAGESSTLTASGLSSYTWTTGSFSNVIVVSPSVTTSYTVTGSSTLQCAANASSVSVVVKPSPTLTAISNRTVICAGENATLTAAGANTYAWVQGPNTSTVVISPMVTTIYTVTGSLSNGCSKTMTVSQSVSICQSLSEHLLAKIHAYPNPASEKLFIETPYMHEGYRIMLYNNTGQIVFEMQLTGEKCEMDLSKIPAGFYFIHWTDSMQNIKSQLKVVKE